MKRSGVLVVAATLALMTTGAAIAQQDGGGQGGQRPGRGQGGGGNFGGGFGRGGATGLLRMTEVQQELKLTPEQITKIQALQPAGRGQGGPGAPGGSGGQGGPGGGPGAPGGGPGGQGGGQMNPEEWQRQMAERREQQRKALAEILTADQMKRLRQLEVQQQGASALGTKEVADELKLTEDQRNQIASVQRDSQTAMRNAMQGQNFRDMSQEERTAFMTRMQAARKATDDKLVSLLTAEQKTQWQAMQGAPFIFPANNFGGFGGGNRGGGNRGGGNRGGGGNAQQTN